VNDDLKAYIRQKLGDEDVSLIFPEGQDEPAYVEHAGHADIIVGWRPSEQLLSRAVKLELFINPGAGVQHLIEPFRALNERRPVALVNGHGNAFFTAEHIMAMLLSVTNRLLPHHQWMLEGKWRLGDKIARSESLRTRCIGLLGYGHINRQVHAFLAPFCSRILVCRKHPAGPGEYRADQLHELLSAADVLIITLPSTPQTRGLIGRRELELLGANGILINAGRGEVVEEEALYLALKNKVVAQAAIDVWYEYHPEVDELGRQFPFHFPFNELDNILLSPHRAASPFNDLSRWDDVIENIRRHSRGETLLNVVDLEEGY
jgi:phosphoglycerate dehydrogenase-like enzyme